MQHKHGGDIYSYKTIKDFSANINFRGMPEAVRTAASAAIASSVHYPDPEYRKLREALAERENQLLKRQKGMQCGTVLPQHLICGNGAAELMFALASAVSPRRALLAVPSFFEYEQALASVGCEIDRFRLHEEDQFGVRDDFLNEIGKETDIIILGNPNNPTGRLLEKEFLEKLRQVCGRRGILLVLDESFSDFLCAQDQMRTCHGAEWAIQEKNVFVIRSFTKMYAMPGLRFGYGICSDTVLLERMHLRLQPWNVSVPAQAAAEAAARELHFAEETALQTRCNRTEMQRQMEEGQKELETKEFIAKTGGGAVEVAVNGKKEVLRITLSEEIVDPEDIETLQDAVMAAVNEAMRQADAASAELMGKMTGGLGGMPF